MTDVPQELPAAWRRDPTFETPEHPPIGRAFWRDQKCTLVKFHAPTPSITEYHHSKPVFLQNVLYGQIVYGPDTWLCSNCHDSVHEWLYWLLGRRVSEPDVGRAAKAEAERTYAWYLAEEEDFNEGRID